MAKKTLVSVVIPAYNEGKYLEKCLKGIFGQSRPNFDLEVIVANDWRSTDQTGEIAKKLGATEIIVKKPTPAYARQKGVEKAQGEIIACVDADTLLPDNHLANIVSEFAKDPQLVGLTGLMDGWGGSFWERFFYKWSNILLWSLTFALGKRGFQGQSFAFRKEAFLKIGGFNTSIYTGEDVDLGYRMSKVGKVKLLKRIVGISSIRRMKKDPLLKAVSRGFLTYLKYVWGINLTQKDTEPFPPAG